MDTKKLKEVLHIFEASHLTKMEVESKELRMVFEQSKDSVPSKHTVIEPLGVNNEGQTNDTMGEAIKCPLVGTFYAARGENEAPFVHVGQQVKKGDTIGIIEAMKSMNELQATRDGIISSIEVSNGDFVGFDSILMYME